MNERTALARSNAEVISEVNPDLGGALLTRWNLTASWGQDCEGALLAERTLEHNAAHVLDGEVPCSGVEC